MLNLHILAIGERMPSWVEQGYQDYKKRLPFQVHFKALAAVKRGKGCAIEKVLLQECQRLQENIPEKAFVIALDRLGKKVNSEQFASYLETWQQEFHDVVFIIGGPEGLDQTCLDKASSIWSLSELTFPHPLVRLILIEQIYRAYSILQQHPYHR